MTKLHIPEDVKNAAVRTSNVAHSSHFPCTISHCTRRCKCTKQIPSRTSQEILSLL